VKDCTLSLHYNLGVPKGVTTSEEGVEIDKVPGYMPLIDAFIKSQ
jgi:hypothetical protein